MSIIPEEELKGFGSLNLAPMVDFLFLVVAVFATLAVTKAALYDSEIKLVKVQPASEHSPFIGQNDYYIINLSVNEEGQYKWITEFNEYLIDGVKGIQGELKKQQDLGLLPKEKEKTKVLLHIDRNAKWEPISQVIFSVRQAGFEIHPVYDYDEGLSPVESGST
ncbi:MAG: biopolymer transporter ExbD [Verrucomicrobia bacterium]|nr:biopolymer transporter ExbD [Verrucomicrobiota bacterium]